MRILIGIIFFLWGADAYSQTNFEYTYDNGGNRIKRQVVVLTKSLTTAAPDSLTSSAVPVVDETSNFKVKIYPNPTAGLVRVEVEPTETGYSGDVNIQLLSSYGRVLMANKKRGLSFELNLSSYSDGVYILNLFFNGKRLSFKLIKKG